MYFDDHFLMHAVQFYIFMYFDYDIVILCSHAICNKNLFSNSNK